MRREMALAAGAARRSLAATACYMFASRLNDLKWRARLKAWPDTLVPAADRA
jgi:hypothetical protein